MLPQGPMIYLHTVGPLVIRAADGSDLLPKGRKAQALLALLARAPSKSRPRSWLQDKLWSDRGPDQGSASLRQTLTEIRRAFGAARDCLLATRTTVALDVARIAVFDYPPETASTGDDDPILFEGLDVRDPEFDNWLRDQRSAFDEKRLNHSPEPISAGHEFLGGTPAPADIGRLRLVLSPVASSAQPRARILADTMVDLIARTIMELGSIEIVDLRRTTEERQKLIESQITAPALQVGADVLEDQSGSLWRLVLSSLVDSRMISSVGSRIEAGQVDVSDASILRDLNQIVDSAIRNFTIASPRGHEQRIATLVCQQGVRRLFMLGRENLLIADRLFQRAFDIEKRGLFLAWRAYVRTYLIAELLADDDDRAREEALALAQQALELEPHNSFVVSFAAHVHAIARRSYVTSYEMAERSVRLNPANPLGWASLGISECHLGKPKVGFDHALYAREISVSTPFYFQVSALACIAGSMAGDVEKSIFLGEATHGMAPGFKPPLRFLSALYLLRGDHEKSQEMVSKLQVLEPSFSYEMLRDKAYPAASLHRARLLGSLPARQV